MDSHSQSTTVAQAARTQVSSAVPQIRTAFLDRDGTINQKAPEGDYVSTTDTLRLIPGVAEAIGKLNHAGIRVLVVTNQRGVALGLYTMAHVDAIHSQLQDELSCAGAHVDGFYVCPHDKDACICRKPGIGLFQQAQRDYPDVKAESSAIVGDSLSDVQFGQRAGMYTVFIRREAGESAPGNVAAELAADFYCNSLGTAVDVLLTQGTGMTGEL